MSISCIDDGSWSQSSSGVEPSNVAARLASDLLVRRAHILAGLDVLEQRTTIRHAHRIDAAQVVTPTVIEDEIANRHAADHSLRVIGLTRTGSDPSWERPSNETRQRYTGRPRAI